MKKFLLNRWIGLIIILPVFFNNAKAICVTTFTNDTVNIACGDSFTFGGVAYYVPITQTDTFVGIHGCDSVVMLYLTVTDTINILRGLCSGDSIFFYGNWIKTPGQVDTLIVTPNICDSLVVLSINVVDPLPPTYIYDTICSNDSLLFNGVYVDTAGVYTTHFNPPNACDSIVILTLAVNPAPVVTFTWDLLFAVGDVLSYSYYPNGYLSQDTAVWCIDGGTSPFVLTGGNPRGGYYSGNGISNDTFNRYKLLASLNGFDTITYTYTEFNGCQRSVGAILIVVACEGIQEIPDQYSLNLYPNPAHDYLTVEHNGFTTNSQIEIMDVLGRMVKMQRVTGPVTNMQVDIAALSNGLYFLRIVNDVGAVSEGRPALPAGRFSVVR